MFSRAKGKPRQRARSRDEVVRLLRGFSEPHLKLFAILAITTGGRSKATLELTWDRVNFAEGWIDLRLEDDGDHDITFKGYKRGRARVHMNDLVRAALIEHYQWPCATMLLSLSANRSKG